MASVPRSIGSQQNFNKIPVLGLVAENAATASPPANPVNGQFWYDSTINRLYIRENGAWVLASQTGTEQTANKGAANGYAPLNGSSQVPLANLPVAASGTSSATAVVRADDSRLADSRTPSGTISAGDLTGSYPSPTIGANKVVAAKIGADLVPTGLTFQGITGSAAAGTPALRALGTAATDALAGTTRLDQIAVPTAAVALNGQRITGLADPTAGSDAATKQYVDARAAGFDPKASVRAASVANLVGVTYNATGGTSGRGQFTAMPNALDGVILAAGNRVLLKDQTTGAQNGIWVVTTLGTGANGVWDRAPDFDEDAEVTAGAFTFVEEGTTNDNTGWVLGTNNPITIGGASGTALTWVKFTGGTALTAGAGLLQTGSTFDVVGTAGRIVANADSIDIDSGYVGQTSITTVGTIGTGVWSGTAIAVAKGGTGATDAPTARANLGVPGYNTGLLGAMTAGAETLYTHNLGNKSVQAQFFEEATGYEVTLAWRQVSTTQIGVTPDLAYAASAVRAVVMG